MRKVLGVVAACAVLVGAGCGGVAELDASETQTVDAGKAAITAAAANGSLKPGDKEKIESLMILCHEKPLAETDDGTVREVVKELAPELKGVDKEMHRRMKRIADHGCG